MIALVMSGAHRGKIVTICGKQNAENVKCNTLDGMMIVLARNEYIPIGQNDLHYAKEMKS